MKVQFQIYVINRDQNRRQKVFNRGALGLCGRIDTIKLTKTQLIYSVSYFIFGKFGALFGGLSPEKKNVVTGLVEV